MIRKTRVGRLVVEKGNTEGTSLLQLQGNDRTRMSASVREATHGRGLRPRRDRKAKTSNVRMADTGGDISAKCDRGAGARMRWRL